MCMRCCIRVIKDLRNPWDSRDRFHTCVVYRDTPCRNYLTAIDLCNTGSCAQSFACQRRYTTDQYSHERKKEQVSKHAMQNVALRGQGAEQTLPNCLLEKAKVHDRVSATTWSIQEYVCVCTYMKIKMMTGARSQCVPLEIVHRISYINCLEREFQQMQKPSQKMFQSLV